MEMRNVDEQRTAAVRLTTPVEKLPEVMGEVYGEVAGFLARRGLEFAGPPFALYYNMDMAALDVEMGFPVTIDVEGEGRVFAGSLPGGPTACTVHIGPYSELERTYTALMEYVQGQGLEVQGWTYETYLNSPEDTPPEKLRTEIFYPIKS